MVTGAGGMLAHAVSASLSGAGDRTLGVFLDDAEAAAGRGRFDESLVHEFGRASDAPARLEGLARAAEAFRPDWVLHLAAWTDVDGCEADPGRAARVNAEGCREAARVAGRCGARLMAISTDYVFDGAGGLPYLEDDAVAPASAYGRSKLAGEAFVREADARHLVVRTAWLFGPHGRNFVDTIRARLEQGQPVRVVDDQRGCPTLTTDLAGALRSLAGSDARGVVHVVNAGDATWCELAREVARHLGREALVTPITTEELGRPAPRPRYSVLDTSRYASIAGQPLPHWRDALRRHLAGPPTT